MGILDFNSIYLATTLAVFHTNLYFFQKCWNFQFFIFFPPSNKKNLKENIDHSRKFYLIEIIFQIIYLFIWQTFFEACYQVMFFFKKLINYLTNIGSTCQGITIYDIIIRCKSKHPPPFPPQNNLGGILKKIYLFKVPFLENEVNKWMQLVILPNKKHIWLKKGIPPTPKV